MAGSLCSKDSKTDTQTRITRDMPKLAKKPATKATPKTTEVVVKKVSRNDNGGLQAELSDGTIHSMVKYEILHHSDCCRLVINDKAIRDGRTVAEVADFTVSERKRQIKVDQERYKALVERGLNRPAIAEPEVGSGYSPKTFPKGTTLKERKMRNVFMKSDDGGSATATEEAPKKKVSKKKAAKAAPEKAAKKAVKKQAKEKEEATSTGPSPNQLLILKALKAGKAAKG